MYKYDSFYEIYDRQLLKTRAYKERKTQGGWFLLNWTPSKTRVLTWALLGAKQTQRPDFTQV